MKLYIVFGCLMVASVGFAQQSPQTTRVDSLRNPDNMPVVRNSGKPVPMPVMRNSGAAAAMPTHRMSAPDKSEEHIQDSLNQLDKLKNGLRSDSTNRVQHSPDQPAKRK